MTLMRAWRWGGPPPETENPFATRSPMVERDPFAAETDSHVQAVPDIELDLGELDDEGEKEEAPVDSHLFSSNSSLEDETDLTSQGFVGQPQQPRQRGNVSPPRGF